MLCVPVPINLAQFCCRKNPQLIADGAKLFGNQCIVLAIDARKCGENKWEVYVQGGRKRRALMLWNGQKRCGARCR